MKITIKKKMGNDTRVGALRLSVETFVKIRKIAEREKVSNQTVIRAILDKVIDRVEIAHSNS